MQGPNRKPGSESAAESTRSFSSPAPQNQNGLATARILALLNQIGDRLIRNEEERMAVREALSDLENRADAGERIFLTLQDKLSKNETVEDTLRQRQDKLEQLYRENEARLARAEALADKIEEAIALQNRLARRLEKTAQDKAHILTKIERIEEGIEKTRSALNSPALIQLAEQAASQGWLPQAPANDPYAQEPRSTLKKRAAYTASLLVAGLLAGLSVSQLALHWPQTTPPAAERQAVPSEQTAALPDHLTTDETRAPAVASQSTSGKDIAPYGEDAMQKAMDANPDQVAASLNAIEPGHAAAKQDQTASIEPVAEPSADTKISPAENTPQIQEKEPAAAPVALAGQAATRAPAPAPAAEPLPVKDGFDAEAFVKAQIDRSRPITQRIQPDPNLPPVVKAIETKAFEGVPEAQHDLAAIYTAGHAGVQVDFKRAAAWFGEASAGGIANARYNLGVLYHQGLGVPKDINKAIGWYRSAAALGHPEAEYNLGIACIEGVGTPYDPKAAVRYFKQAAKGGVLEASYNLGLIYENGLLGGRDLNEAAYWYSRSADSAPEARMALTRVMRLQNLNDADIEKLVAAHDSVHPEDAPPKTEHAATATRQDGKSKIVTDPAEIAKSIPPLTREETRQLLGKDAATPQKTGTGSASEALTRQIQEQLARLNLFSGESNGVAGAETEKAIRAYQEKNGLPVTGQPSEDLLVRLLASEINASAGL